MCTKGAKKPIRDERLTNVQSKTDMPWSQFHTGDISRHLESLHPLRILFFRCTPYLHPKQNWSQARQLVPICPLGLLLFPPFCSNYQQSTPSITSGRTCAAKNLLGGWWQSNTNLLINSLLRQGLLYPHYFILKHNTISREQSWYQYQTAGGEGTSRIHKVTVICRM